MAPASRLQSSRLGAILNVLLATATLVQGTPAPVVPTPAAGGVAPLTAPEVSSFKPYTYFASAGYCDPKDIRTWSCGRNCDANPGFKPVAAGGDGVVTQFCKPRWNYGEYNANALLAHIGFVGYDPSLDEIIVSHQGTDTDVM